MSSSKPVRQAGKQAGRQASKSYLQGPILPLQVIFPALILSCGALAIGFELGYTELSQVAAKDRFGR